MTGIEAIKNYISYTNKPFTSTQIVAELGICYENVKKYLQELIKSEYIKQIGRDKGKKVYVFNRFKQTIIFKARNKRYTLYAIQEAYYKDIKERRKMLDLL